MSKEERGREAADGAVDARPASEGPGPGPVAQPDPRAEQWRQLEGLPGAERGLDYVAWCTLGRCEFERDVFDDPPSATGLTADEADPGAVRAGPEDVAGFRNACRQLAEKLSLHTDQQLDQRLAVLGTGRLIRTVLATDQGAFYCDQVVPGTYLVGGTVGMPPEPAARQELTYRADENLAQQVEAFRDRIHAQALNLGGWRSQRLRAELRTARQRLTPTSVEDTGELPGGFSVVTSGSSDHPAVARCRVAVQPRDLHLVSLFDDTRLVFSVDVLQDARLSTGEDHELTPSLRRTRYAELGAELPDYLRDLGRTARKAIGGPLRRAVLDVERGAVYYRRIDDSQYILGVTIFQPRVRTAEDRIDQLIAGWPR